MASIRTARRIQAPAQRIWDVIANAGQVHSWFPLVKTAEIDGDIRTAVLQDGSVLKEQIVTVDAQLYRFQYRVIGGDLPFEHHLGTIDVIALNDEESLVVYGTDVQPESLALALGPAIDDAVNTLAQAL